jgi:formate/nitrite transporter
MNEIFGFDAFSPKEIASRVENIGVIKARMPLIPMIMLGILAGAFIGLGAMFSVIVSSDPTISFGFSRILSGFVFSLGLILVVVAGAELFTGNNLIAMAWADGKISGFEVLRNWLIISISNFIGAVVLVFFVYMSKHPEMNQHAIALQYLKIASAKCSLPFMQAIFSGVMCNILVCLAVWMSQAGRSVIDKVIVIVFPITAFVAAGFEHSVANMYYIPMGMLLKSNYPDVTSAELISLFGMFKNLFPVILGNLCGGSVFVALVYFLIYGEINRSKI